MPYRHAHWWVLAILPLAGLAFWPGYLSQVATAPGEYHLHGITATLWLLLLAAQGWTIHHRRRELHRTLGIASLALFPLFLAGGIGIFIAMARRYVDDVSPFYALYAPRLAWIDVVSVAAFAWFYHEALRRRREVRVHAGYLLATSILLLPPILGRIAPLPLGLTIEGPADFWKLAIGFQVANGVTAALCFGLALRTGRHGRPFAEAGVAVLIFTALFQFVGPMAWWHAVFAQFARPPSVPIALCTAIAGAAIAASGWISGRAPVRGAAV